MTNARKLFAGLTAIAAIAAAALPAEAASRRDINISSRAALARIEESNPAAARLAHDAKAILIFPNIVKGGLVFGGSFGEGELISGKRIDGFYNSASASWGLQAGVQSYSYVVFLMTDKAVRYIHETHGWEIGVGPTVVIVNEGVAKNLSTTTLKDDAYAFIFGQQGLMAGVSIEGAKVTRIKK